MDCVVPPKLLIVLNLTDIDLLTEVLRIGPTWSEAPKVVLYSNEWHFFYQFTVSREMTVDSVAESYLAKAKVWGLYSRLMKWRKAPQLSKVAYALSLAHEEVRDNCGMIVLL